MRGKIEVHFGTSVRPSKYPLQATGKKPDLAKLCINSTNVYNSAALSQLAFLRESDPNFPWEELSNGRIVVVAFLS